MKKPKEILLEHHRKAEPSLDTIRVEVCRALEREPVEPARATKPRYENWLGMFWQELFVSCRRYWMALGTAWCVIVLVTVAGAGGPTEANAAASTNPEAGIQAMLDHQRLRAELLGLASVEKRPVARHEENPGPRSEAIAEFVNV